MSGLTDQQFLERYPDVNAGLLDRFRIWAFMHWYAFLRRVDDDLGPDELFVKAIVLSAAPIVDAETAHKWITRHRGLDVNSLLRDMIPMRMATWDERAKARESCTE